MKKAHFVLYNVVCAYKITKKNLGLKDIKY